MNRYFSFIAKMQIAFILYSCSKEKNNDIVPAIGNYFPLNAGSFWNYNGYASKGNATNINTVLLGISYSILQYESGFGGSSGNCRLFDTCYFRKENGKYFQAISTNQLPFAIDTSTYYEFVFMEDNAPVGTVWNKHTSYGTYTFSNGKVSLEQSYISKLEAYLPTYKVYPVYWDSSILTTYNDVVKINTSILTKAFDASHNNVLHVEEVYYKWYAKDIGLIKATHSTEHYNMVLLNYRIF